MPPVVCSAKVHPRIRGERAGRAHRARRASGSSPHTRGTLGFRQLQRRRQRFIPAYAGNARLLVPARRADAVHPRIRGERKLAKLPPEKVAGSSPHTRGTRAHGEHVRCASRFIPAYAGNAGSARAGACTAAVHPRIRGERDIVRAHVNSANGSSPHTRGTPRPQMMQGTRRRFIPAYAGNAPRPVRQRRQTPVHPRIRGERARLVASVDWISGSSPHTRGTLRSASLEGRAARFIPAYAGNAVVPSASFRTAPVHPRIRGERF